MTSSQQDQPPLIPKNWNYTVTQPYPDRLRAAEAAVSAGVSKLNTGGYVPGDNSDLEKTFAFYSTMGNLDAVANQSNFQGLALEFLDLSFRYFDCGEPPCSREVEVQFIIQRGYAIICGYLAYKDERFLDQARYYWEIANLYTISDLNPQLVSGSPKNFSLVKECTSYRGGKILTSIQSTGPDSSNVTLFNSALFFRLSALMAVSSHGQNNTYILAAQQSAQFLMNARFNYYLSYELGDQAESGINVPMGDPTGCDTVPDIHNGVIHNLSATFTSFSVDKSITGLLIEGLSYLFSLDMNSTIREMLLATILGHGAPTPFGESRFGQWSVTTGVLQTSCQNHSGDPFLLRGLSEASKISNLPSNVVDYIKGFIAAQYNALRAGSQPSNIYGCSWDTPPPSSYDATNQTRSAQLLIDGITVFNETQSTSTTSSTGTPPTNTSPITSQLPRAHNQKTAAVAGSVVGGIAFILVICLVIFLFRRRKHRELNDAADKPPDDQEIVITPFIWNPPQEAFEPSRVTQSKDYTRPVPQLSQSRNSIQFEGIEAYLSDHPSASPAADPRERVAANDIMPSTDGEASFPELIRLLYQRMWQSAGHEHPPDYQSQSG